MSRLLQPTVRLLAVGVSCALLTARLSTQAQVPSAEPVFETSSIFGVGETTEGRPMVFGNDFRMLFDPGSVVFQPALGDRVTSTEELRYTFESVRIGADAIVEASVPATPRFHGSRLVYHHASGVEEHYDPRGNGVEQSFVLQRRPEARGDLVVRGRLECTFPLFTSNTQGLEFAREGIGAIHLGAVTGIDAEGWSMPGEVRFAGGYVEYVLPANFVAKAVFPLTVDPLLGADVDVSDSATGERFEPDVAYNAGIGLFELVWEVAYSSSDHDLYGHRFFSHSPGSGFSYVLRGTPGLISTAPAVATVLEVGATVYAWSEAAVAGVSQVFVQSFDVPGMTGATLVGEGVRPDLGGEAVDGIGAEDALVVWTNDSGVQAAKVRTTSSTAPPLVFDHATFLSGANYSTVAVSKSGGEAGRWAVTAQRLLPLAAPQSHELDYALVGRDLSLHHGPATIANPGLDLLDPDVDGDGTEFMLLFSKESPPGNYRIHYRAIDESGAVLAEGRLMHAPSSNERHPAVTFAGNRWMIAFENRVNSRVRFLNYCTSAWELCSSVEDTTTFCQRPSICAWLSSDVGERTDEGFLAFSRAGTFNQIRLREYDATPSTSYFVAGAPCGATIDVTPRGEWIIGNADFGFDISVTDPNATFAMINARPGLTAFGLPNTGAITTCGSCELMLELGNFIIVPIVSGAGFHPVPIRASLDLLGAAVVMQVFAGLTLPSPCPLAPNYSASRRFAFEIEY